MKLHLNAEQVERCRASARSVGRDVANFAARRTTVSIERAILRLLGVDGMTETEVPFPNVVIDHIASQGGLGRGVCRLVGNAMVQTGLPPQEIAEQIHRGELDLFRLESAPKHVVEETVRAASVLALRTLEHRHQSRRKRREEEVPKGVPLVYVLTATGNVYEDVAHEKMVAEFGGDIVAVIRSTAQSLLDYVPFGPTTEGFGGTYATQANFRIMREVLDEWTAQHGRYVRLSSFCSGLCMPEIAVMGAIEGLDNMVNDALYGILYRDINMARTLVDQRFSRMVNGHFGITINTGEDNYLRTSDAIEAAPAVVASQFINYFLARESGCQDRNIAVGSAFEVSPEVENGLLYEWAHAQLTRELFPHCPVKHMPPTRHMDGNLFRTHACDVLFNLVSVATGQEIQTIGVPTEGIFTPHIHDRALGLEAVHYVYKAARDLKNELSFRQDGFIVRQAQSVLDRAEVLLEEIRREGLFRAIERGVFGDVSRSEQGGRGVDGLSPIADDYFNAFAELMGCSGDDELNEEASEGPKRSLVVPKQTDSETVRATGGVS